MDGIFALVKSSEVPFILSNLSGLLRWITSSSDGRVFLDQNSRVSCKLLFDAVRVGLVSSDGLKGG